MAKSKIAEEKEYQDAVKYTSSIIGDLKRAIEDTAEASDLRNKKIFEEISLTKKVLSSLKDEKSYEEALIKLSTQKGQVLQSNFGINDKMKSTYLAQLDAADAIVKKELARLKIINETQRIADNLQNKFVSSLDSIGNKIKGIPIIGESLFQKFWTPFSDKAKGSIDAVKKRFMTQFKTGFTQATNKGANMMDSFSSGLGRGFTSAKKLSGSLFEEMSGFLGPKGRLLLGVAALAVGLYLAFKVGLERFKELDAAAKAFREETGLLNSQTKSLQNNIKNVSTEFAGLGVTAEDVSKSAAAFTQIFGGLEQPSQAVLGSMVALNKNFGIGVEQGAELNKVFQNIGGLTAEQSQALIGQTVEMAKMAGVAPRQVIQDMAESSEYAYRYFNGSPKALAAAAVQAAKLGTSIKQAGEVADNLLDFESSITSELEASAILGTNLNLSQARYLAANGDILGAQQAVLDQVASLGDITKLNKFEQDALTKATGMQMGDLINQQRIREQFGKLDKEQLAAAMSLMNSGRDITKLNADDLKAQTAKLATQKEMQSVMDDLSNSGSAISTAFSDMFEPLAANIMPVIADLASMVSSVLVPAFRLVGSVIKLALAPFGFILGVLGAVGKAVTNFLVTPLNFVLNSFNRIVDALTQAKDMLMVFSGIFAALLIYQQWSLVLETKKMLMTKAGTLWEFIKTTALSAQNGVRLIGEAIQKKGLLKSIADLAINAGKAVAGIPVVGPLLMAAAAAGAFALGMSFFSKAGDVNSPADGKTRISTKEGGLFELSKNDDLMAAPGLSNKLTTKKTGGLAKPAEGGIGGLLGSIGDYAGSVAGAFNGSNIIIEKLDELIFEVGGSRDVYMDKEKVSSSVVKTNEKSGENRFGLMGA